MQSIMNNSTPSRQPAGGEGSPAPAPTLVDINRCVMENIYKPVSNYYTYSSRCQELTKHNAPGQGKQSFMVTFMNMRN